MIHRLYAPLRKFGDVGFLALISYIPALCVSDGTYNADTKLYLTTNVGRLLSNARYAWDPSQFGGYVPHQAVGYLWPMGPFYWLFDVVGLPGWFAQRAFVASLFFLASMGVLRLLRHLGYEKGAAVLAAIAYQFTPYVLAYQSRTSAMLLPWCGLPWIVLATQRGVHSFSWRYPAIVALIVASIGGINATSLIMIAPAPIILVVDAVLRDRAQFAPARRFTIRAGLLCTLVSMWWLVMVVIQGRYGADVLAYSETLEAVSSTSTSTEVFRGLGYWLNYVVTPTYSSTSRALLYLSDPLAICASYIVPIVGVIGLAFVQTRIRRAATWWLFAGVVLAVGVYPLQHSSLLTHTLASNPESSLSLALRSSTRAIPMINLALVIGVAGVYSLTQRALDARVSMYARRSRRALLPVCVLICIAVVPSRFVHGLSDQALAHESLPKYWSASGAQIHERLGDDARALQLPGQEFGAYTWGYTVDPALAAATASPTITRDLLPLGNSQTMDLLNAIDDAARLGALDSNSVVRLAQQLGAGALIVPHDLDFVRFGTPSSRELKAKIGTENFEAFGLGEQSVDVRYFAKSSIARLATGPTVVEGSGEGLVNIARARVDSGLVMYASDMSDQELRSTLNDGASLIVTDSNRVQARHWRGSLDTIGMSEDSVDSRYRVTDTADRRLPVFSTAPDNTRTLVVQKSPTRATASTYGFPLGYWPESRPALAVDGRMETAWTTGAFSNPVGQSITLSGDMPILRLRLVQPESSRWITKVSVKLDDGSKWYPIVLEERARLRGQPVTLPSSAQTVTVRIDEVRDAPANTSTGNWGPEFALDGVGFAEMVPDVPVSDEETLVPSRALALLMNGSSRSSGGRSDDISYVFSRQRAPQSSWWRNDPEVHLQRTFLATGGRYQLVVHGHLGVNDEKAAASIIGVSTFAKGAMSDGFAHAGWSATDGDSTTSWRVRYGQTRAPSLVFRVTSPMDTISLVQCQEDDCNSATRVRITDDSGNEVTRSVEGSSIDVRGLRAGVWTMQVVDGTHRSAVDPRFWVRIRLPIEIFELLGEGITNARPLESAVDAARLVLPLALNSEKLNPTIKTSDFDAFGTFAFTTDVDLLSGKNNMRSLSSPLLIDDIVLTPAGSQSLSSTNEVGYSPLDMRGSPTHRTIDLPARPSESWLVFAEGYSPGWTARYEGQTLSGHRQVEGGFNAWRLPASKSPGTVTLTFGPQRYATIAQVASFLGLLACACVVFVTRRQRSVTVPDRIQFVLDGAVSRGERARLVAVLLVVGLIALPSQAFALLLAASLGVALSRRLRLLWALSLIFVGYSVFRVVLRVLSTNPPARFDWPSTTSAFHNPLLVGLLVLAVAVTLTDRPDASH